MVQGGFGPGQSPRLGVAPRTRRDRGLGQPPASCRGGGREAHQGFGAAQDDVHYGPIRAQLRVKVRVTSCVPKKVRVPGRTEVRRIVPPRHHPSLEAKASTSSNLVEHAARGATGTQRAHAPIPRIEFSEAIFSFPPCVPVLCQLSSIETVLVRKPVDTVLRPSGRPPHRPCAAV